MKITILLFLLPLLLFGGNKSFLKDLKKSQNNAKKALEVLDMDKAKVNALRAISIIEKYSLTTRDLADIYIIAGVLDLTIEDGSKAKHYFKKALKLDSTSRIPTNFSSDSVEKIFLDAKEELEKDSYKILFSYPKSFKVTKDFPIEVKVAPLIKEEGYVLTVFYRTEGVNFESLTLKQDNKKFIGKIKREQLKGSDLEVYLVLMDSNLTNQAFYGTEERPLDITLVQSNKKSDEKVKKLKEPTKVTPSLFAFNIKTGVGAGLVTDGDLVFTTKNLSLDPGILLSPIWFGGDISFFVSDKLLVGLDLRVQNYSSKDSPVWTVSILSKLILLKNDKFKLLVGGGLGYGEVAYQVDISAKDPKQKIDIVKNGSIHLNLESSFIYMLTRNFGLSSTFRLDIIAPSLSILGDLNLGLYLEF